MRRISQCRGSLTFAHPSRVRGSSIKTHPPKANAWPPVSCAPTNVPSPKSLAWAGPYANGDASWPTSTQAKPTAHRTEAINGHYRTWRATARGYHPTATTNSSIPIGKPRRIPPTPTLKSPAAGSPNSITHTENCLHPMTPPAHSTRKSAFDLCRLHRGLRNNAISEYIGSERIAHTHEMQW